jgi:peptidoglycan hydrolase CwlO-like protein
MIEQTEAALRARIAELDDECEHLCRKLQEAENEQERLHDVIGTRERLLETRWAQLGEAQGALERLRDEWAMLDEDEVRNVCNAALNLVAAAERP